MDKAAIKKYAIWARRELIERVSQKAMQYGITGDGENDPSLDSVNGKLLSDVEKKQRQALIKKVRQQGYEQAMEEAAYTWFNRFAALRFMEVNGYLPSHVRVFTDDDGNFKPQILSEAIHLEIDGLNMDKVYELKNANKNEELFKYLLITQCNALSAILPGMFQKIADYTELLLPDNLLREGSVIERMVSKDEGIPESDWTDQVQIIGWLYQYYNTEPKDKVFADLRKNIKITKEKIPAATQLFTPDWIVHYMVENSLGRLWLEGHPNDALKAEWKYYLDEAEQEPDVQAQLDEIRKEYAALKPEEIRCIDPCMGSGHILCVLFDTLVQIYEDYGYTAREAAGSIVEKNLWGLDIDERAAQLAYFAVMMKARQYDRRFFSRGIQPHVYAIVESNAFDQNVINYFVNNDDRLRNAMDTLKDTLHNAKEYGSILSIPMVDFSALYARFNEIKGCIDLLAYPSINELLPFVQMAEMMTQKYHITCTNPPYMGIGGMGSKLSDLLKKNYPNSKSDLFAVFIERCNIMTKLCGYQAMITQHAWMFLSSYEKLRKKIQSIDIINMAHLGARSFEEINGEVVQTTSFIFRNTNIHAYKGIYCRLIDATTQQGKEADFFKRKNRYIASQENFVKIPGNPIAYWVSSNFVQTFDISPLKEMASACIGMRTGNNDRFLRFWYEVDNKKIGFGRTCAKETIEKGDKWIPYNKGGGFRKWYGNHDYVVNWENDGYEIKENTKRVYPQLGDNIGWKISNEKYYFLEGICWTVVTSKVCFRRYYAGHIFSNSGQAVISNKKDILDYLTGLLNSKYSETVLNMISPTLGFESGYVNKIPVVIDLHEQAYINNLTNDNILLSKVDWDSFETSWDFTRQPMVHSVSTVEEAYAAWETECINRFNQLKANEEELNRIFIDIYGLQDELTPEVEDKDVTVRKADLGRDIRSLISYAVGCMFGRYSLHKEGLIFAGGKMGDVYQYRCGKLDGGWRLDGTVSVDGKAGYYLEGDTYLVDPDNIIPICDDDYFDDDITGRFIEWVELVYGTETLEENLQFIADALGGKGTSREVIRTYFINGFYADHCKVYQKRPIYWLFDSGKKNGFKCLIYMHRYQPDTIARIRTDYVHEQQSRYRTAMEDLEQRMNDASTSERVKLKKRLAKMQAQAEEIREYEEKIHHLADQMIGIDLDDGVKHNYKIFQDVLAKIK